MLKLFWRSVVLAALILSAVAVRELRDQSPAPNAQTPDATPTPTIEKMVGLSSLTTLRVEVADVLVDELPGRTGSVHTILVIRGEVTLGVDLSAARFTEVDAANRRAVLDLPQPTVESAELDKNRTKLVAVWESGLWAITPGGGDADTASINLALAKAQKIVEAAGNDPELIRRSRLQTQQVIAAFLRNLGWYVQIRWGT